MIANGTGIGDWEFTDENHISAGWMCHYSEDYNPCIMCYFDVSIDEWPSAFEDDSLYSFWG